MCLCFLLALTQEEKSWSLRLQGWDNVNKEEFWVGVSLRQEGSPPLPGQTIPKEWNNVSSRKSRKKKKMETRFGDWMNYVLKLRNGGPVPWWHWRQSVDISQKVLTFLSLYLISGYITKSYWLSREVTEVEGSWREGEKRELSGYILSKFQGGKKMSISRSFSLRLTK